MLKLINLYEYIWWHCLAFVPTIITGGAQTSIVSFPYALMTQWYTNEEHECDNFSQPLILAALFHSLLFWGHDFTIFAVSAESSHLGESPKICKWWIIILCLQKYFNPIFKIKYIVCNEN